MCGGGVEGGLSLNIGKDSNGRWRRKYLFSLAQEIPISKMLVGKQYSIIRVLRAINSLVISGSWFVYPLIAKGWKDTIKPFHKEVGGFT